MARVGVGTRHGRGNVRCASACPLSSPRLRMSRPVCAASKQPPLRYRRTWLVTRPAATPIPEVREIRRRPSGGLTHRQEAGIRTQLEDILNSPVFRSSPRMQRFLELVVTESLAG